MLRATYKASEDGVLMANYLEQQKIKWRVLLPLLAILVLDVAGFGLVIPLLKPLFFNPHTSIIHPQTSETLRHLYYGLALALYPMAIVIATPLFGVLSDRIGRKKVLLGSLLISSIALLLCALSLSVQSVSLLLIGRFMAGFSSSSRTVAQAAIADISTNKSKAMYLSLIAAALTVGMVVGPLLGGIFSNENLLQQFNLSTPFLITAVLFFIAAIFFGLIFTETCDKAAQKVWTWQENIQQCFGIFKNLQIIIMLAVFICLEIAWSLYFQTSPLMLARLFEYDATLIGFYTAFLGASMSLGLLIVFRLIIRYVSLSNTAFTGALLAAIGFIGTALVSNVYLYWLFAIPMTMGVGITYTALVTLISNAAGKDLQGWIMGLLAALLSLAWMSTGFLSSFIVAINPVLPILLAAIIMLFASGLFFVIHVAEFFVAAKESSV